MKYLITVVFFTYLVVAQAQAFDGAGDKKVGIGAELVDGGTGLTLSYDTGVGRNFSVGLVGTLLLSADDVLGEEPDFTDKLDIKGRFNVHLVDVLNIDPNFDVYPGINLGLKNLGLHLGARYFFTSGMGVFTEMDFPISKYDDTSTFQYFNGFKVRLGVSLELD